MKHNTQWTSPGDMVEEIQMSDQSVKMISFSFMFSFYLCHLHMQQNALYTVCQIKNLSQLADKISSKFFVMKFIYCLFAL